MTEFWLIFAAACTTWGLCAAALVMVLDDHHPITHLLTALRHLGGTPMHDDEMPDEEPLAPAEQAAAEDGFTSLRAFLARRPFPRQQDRSAA